MALAPKSMQEMEQPPFASDRVAIREQLGRLLVHPLFANSKRYPALLAYVVEQTLLGNGTELKERSIGVEVFGRSTTYDANADPVVRITAGEVRKRLTLYYYDPTHNGEMVIELPIGSYVPVFHAPERPAEAIAVVPEPETDQPELPPIAIAPVLPVPNPQRWNLIWIAALAVAMCFTGILIGLRYRPAPAVQTPSNIDRFWEPFTASANPATFCLGETARSEERRVRE